MTLPSARLETPISPCHGTRPVYRIAPDETFRPFITQLPRINGVPLSQDEGTLFVTEYKARKVHAFPIDDGNVKAGEGTLFAEIKTEGSEH